MVIDMSLNKNELHRNLKQKFYFQVPFPMEHAILEDAITAFFKFLEEPDEVKTYIDFSIAPSHRRGEIGFRHRNPDDDIYNDSKDFFHFHPAIFEKYDQFLEENLVVQDFCNKAYPIWNLVYDTTHNILNILDQDYPGTLTKIFDTSCPHIALRFLKYNWQKSGKYLAKPHFDAGSFTLTITESCPGLRIGSGPENLQPVEHKDRHAVFMISSNFKKVMNTNEFSPGWHDVIQLDETLIGKPFARWAIVAFIEAHGVEALPRSETHKYYKELSS